jgi:hypothetical protein
MTDYKDNEITAHTKECPKCNKPAWAVAKNSRNGRWIYECEKCTEPIYGIWTEDMTKKYNFITDAECEGSSKASCGASEMGVLAMPYLFDEKGNHVI